jgi:hypothetical protein
MASKMKGGSPLGGPDLIRRVIEERKAAIPPPARGPRARALAKCLKVYKQVYRETVARIEAASDPEFRAFVASTRPARFPIEMAPMWAAVADAAAGRPEREEADEKWLPPD